MFFFYHVNMLDFTWYKGKHAEDKLLEEDNI